MNIRTTMALGLCGSLFGCADPLQLEAPPDTSELAVGESRAITLAFLRLDVENFERSLSMADLRALPRRTLEETWLLDLDARPLVENALARFAYLPEEEAYALPLPARNMFYLLNMTPENARLEGTALEELVAIGEAVGISPSRILADLAGVGPNDRIASIDAVADAVLQQVIGTHPRARWRPGLVTPQNPEGLYLVPPGAIAVTLEDIATDFGSLAERFGPVETHPGFLRSVSGLGASARDFCMTVRVGVNALPFKGIDASHAAEASVNSMGMQVENAFNFQDPNWMTIEGLEENMALAEMVMTIEESEVYVPGGTSRAPLPAGNSPVWSEAPWVTERLLAEAGRRIAARASAHCTSYAPAGRVSPPFEAVRVCLDSDGWVDIRVDPSVVLNAPPPAPSYFWDLLLDVAQARLHDGGLAEGEANVVMPVRHVPVGVPTTEVVSRIRKNLESNPKLLRGVAEALTENTRGDADFFYVQPEGAMDDWLFFAAPEDIRKDEEGDPVRVYGYRNPGFFADALLTEKISSVVAIENDTTHEKVRIDVGDTLYMEDAEGRRYELTIRGKPSGRRILLVVKRIS